MKGVWTHRKNMLTILWMFFMGFLQSQHHDQQYYPEDDPLVIEKLEKWQDLKFGLLMHWGPYSQWGVVESWSICPEDKGWTQRNKPGSPTTYDTYVKAYENLQTTFNPIKFNPEKWAKAAYEAGMKYLVFTTKHHDGFCMFDTKYSDYKITDMRTPFHTHKKANITKELFEAFREKGLWTGAYFSKPDWNNDDYWWPYFPPKDRNVNYDPASYPERWENFVKFTHNQIMELATDYGKLDILWLDGGWVRKHSKAEIHDFYTQSLVDNSTGFINGTMVDQDIRMDELVSKVRKKQPGLIVVDRAVEGKNQNYLTPENRVPEASLPFPWESCIIAGGGWSYTPKATYMSGYSAIKMLVDIVCKGGNLLLNIAPGPDGTWHNEAYQLLKEIGEWIDINGEGIYGTRAIPPFKNGKLCYTRKNNTADVYAFYVNGEGENKIPEYIQIDDFQPSPLMKVSLLGSKENIVWTAEGSGILVELPDKVRQNPPGDYIWCIKLENIKI